MTIADPSAQVGASNSSPAGNAAPVAAGNWSAENPHTRGHSPARDTREQAAAAAGQTPPVETKVVPDATKQEPARIKVGDLELTEPELRDLMADKATRDSVKLSLPPSPDAYEMKLPADFKGPEGVTFEFNNSGLAVAQARAFAHRHGLSQAAFTELTGIYAGEKAQEFAVFNAAKAAEVGKLGGAGAARVTAVTIG